MKQLGFEPKPPSPMAAGKERSHRHRKTRRIQRGLAEGMGFWEKCIGRQGGSSNEEGETTVAPPFLDAAAAALRRRREKKRRRRLKSKEKKTGKEEGGVGLYIKGEGHVWFC